MYMYLDIKDVKISLQVSHKLLLYYKHGVFTLERHHHHPSYKLFTNTNHVIKVTRVGETFTAWYLRVTISPMQTVSPTVIYWELLKIRECFPMTLVKPELSGSGWNWLRGRSINSSQSELQDRRLHRHREQSTITRKVKRREERYERANASTFTSV